MISFKSFDDLSKLSSDDPAHPIIEDLAKKLLVTTESMARPYDPDVDGWIVLIEENDVDRPLTEIWGEDAYRLIDIPFEGTTLQGTTRQNGVFLGVFLANNQFGLVFVIPDEDWLPHSLRRVLCENLVPETY